MNPHLFYKFISAQQGIDVFPEYSPISWLIYPSTRQFISHLSQTPSHQDRWHDLFETFAYSRTGIEVDPKFTSITVRDIIIDLHDHLHFTAPQIDTLLDDYLTRFIGRNLIETMQNSQDSSSLEKTLWEGIKLAGLELGHSFSCMPRPSLSTSKTLTLSPPSLDSTQWSIQPSSDPRHLVLHMGERQMLLLNQTQRILVTHDHSNGFYTQPHSIKLAIRQQVKHVFSPEDFEHFWRVLEDFQNKEWGLSTPSGSHGSIQLKCTLPETLIEAPSPPLKDTAPPPKQKIKSPQSSTLKIKASPALPTEKKSTFDSGLQNRTRPASEFVLNTHDNGRTYYFGNQLLSTLFPASFIPHSDRFGKTKSDFEQNQTSTLNRLRIIERFLDSLDIRFTFHESREHSATTHRSIRLEISQPEPTFSEKTVTLLKEITDTFEQLCLDLKSEKTLSPKLFLLGTFVSEYLLLSQLKAYSLAVTPKDPSSSDASSKRVKTRIRKNIPVEDSAVTPNVSTPKNWMPSSLYILFWATLAALVYHFIVSRQEVESSTLPVSAKSTSVPLLPKDIYSTVTKHVGTSGHPAQFSEAFNHVLNTMSLPPLRDAAGHLVDASVLEYTHQGVFIHSVPHFIELGPSYLITPDGTVFAGSWIDDTFTPSSRYKINSGDHELLSGHFNQLAPADGQATLSYLDRIAHVEFKNGAYSEGTLEFTQGQFINHLYTGDLNSDGHPHGKGKLELKNSQTIQTSRTPIIRAEGEFVHGSLIRGKLEFASSMFYGECSLNLISLKENGNLKDHPFSLHNGAFYTSISTYYIGQFKDSRFHGKGTSYDNKVIKEGTFKNGDFVYGKMTMADGTIYEGPFKNDRLNGSGKLVIHGSVFEGEFKNGHLLRSARDKNPTS